MSSVLGVTKSLMWNKFKLVNVLLFFYLIELVIILASGILKSKWIGYGEGYLIMSACVVYFAGVILLVRDNERVISNNRYRLVPISETKLYFSNLMTTCFAYGYVGIVTTGMFILSSYTEMKSDIFLHFMIYTDMQWELFIKDSVITVLGIILIWTGSTMIHLLMDFVSNYWALGNSKIATILVNGLILGLACSVIFITLTRMSVIGMSRYMDLVNNTFEKVCLFDIGAIVGTIIINLYLLQNHFETNR